MTTKKVLYYESNLSKGCNYYKEFRNNIAKYCELKIVTGNIKNEILEFGPEIIIIGFSVTDTGEKKPDLDISNIKIPIYIFLNKEYSMLKEKLEWIKNINPPPKKVFTVHHDYKKYQEITGINFYRIMWSADEFIFKKYSDTYKYDFFFSGVIRKEQTDNLRNKIYDNLNLLESKGFKLLVNARFYVNNKYLNNGSRVIFSNNEYAVNINDSKICLSTTGPADLVGTRYFEIMASNKAMIICNRMPKNIYEDILIDKFNCVMFDNEHDFITKCIFYLENENERKKIVDNAYKYFIKNHTWDIKINQLLKHIL